MTLTDGDPEGSQRAFRVLIVCTANQCRSPMAEYLLREALRTAGIDARSTDEIAPRREPGGESAGGESAGGWVIGSAGTRTRGGRPMDPAALAVLTERGIDGSGFVGRALTPSLIRDADLVLAATREHRGQIAQLVPAALSRLFTIRQFGYLADAAVTAVEADPDPSPAAQAASAITRGLDLIARARAARSLVPGRTTEDDLADPVGRPVEDFRRCAAELDVAISGMLRPLASP